MINQPLDKLTLEKLRIDERLQAIEEYVRQGKDLRGSINDTLTAINVKLFGDPKADRKIDRDGLIRRVEALEGDKEDHIKAKDNFLKIAIGAITLAVGSFMLWAWKMLWAGIHSIKG